jgi:ankyrin repeat protein
VLVAALVVVGVTRIGDDADPSSPDGEEACTASPVALIRDARAGRIEAVRRAIAAGADVDEADVHGNRALPCSGPWGETEVVAALLDAGADPGTTDRFGDTVVADAVRFCQDEVLALLLDAGADPEEAGIEPSPLVQAVDDGRTGAVRLLLAAGATPDPVPEAEMLREGEDAADCPQPTAATKAEALAVVLEGGADPDDVLDRAVELKAWDAVAPALDVGADPDADQGLAFGDLGCAGLAPERIGPTCGPVAGVAALTGVPFDAGRWADGPVPALVHVAWAGEAGTTRVLLDAGADPEVVGPLGVTALAAAAATGADAVVDLLLPVVTLPLPDAAIVPSAAAEGAGHRALAARLVAAGA